MKLRFKVAAAVALLAIIGAPLAYAAGLWFGLPIVGGATYCQQLTAGVPGTTAVCSSSVPAGPQASGSQPGTTLGALTGSEMVPADTEVGVLTPGLPGPGSSGAPQTVLVPVPMAASGAYIITQPTASGAGVTVTIPNGISNFILGGTGTIGTTTLTFPTSPLDGQLLRFTSTATLTTIAYLTSGLANVVFATNAKPTTLNPAQNVAGGNGSPTLGFTWLFSQPTLTWYRLQ